MKLIEKLADEAEQYAIDHGFYDSYSAGFREGFRKAREMAQERLNNYAEHLYRQNIDGMVPTLGAIRLAFMGEEEV